MAALYAIKPLCPRMDLGEVVYLPRRLSSGLQKRPEPTFAYRTQDRLDLVKRGRVDGPPDLAVENIVSPDSVETRLRQKA
jgi:Uma2 family endonuclease